MISSKFYLRIYPILKRFFDLFFSGAVLTLASPLFLLIAFLIKLTSKGPIFYQSLRIKQNCKPFICYKFRTMHSDADERLAKILIESPAKKQEWETYYKLKEDPRITPFGKFLRKTSLDEIPQFFNVMIGDMSLVGPRPMARMRLDLSIDEEMALYLGEKYRDILSIPPGLTGLWQTSGRNHLTLEQRTRLDIEYLQKRTFLLDLLLIVKTIPLMVSPKGSF